VHAWYVFSSCSQGYYPLTEPSVGKPKLMDALLENSAHREGSVPCFSSTVRSRYMYKFLRPKKYSLEQEDVVDITPHFSTGDTLHDRAAAAPCLHYCKRWRIMVMNQRRLAFESDGDCKLKGCRDWRGLWKAIPATFSASTVRIQNKLICKCVTRATLLYMLTSVSQCV